MVGSKDEPLVQLVASLRSVDCDNPDLTIRMHELARSLEDHMRGGIQVRPRRPASVAPRFFLPLD